MPAAAILAALLLVEAPAARSWTLDAAASSLRFQLRHPLHAVNGRAKALEARAVAQDGELRAMARAPVASLDTGDANRDANMREVMEAGRFPYVVLRATSRLAVPGSVPAEVPLELDVELEVHGVKRRVAVPVKVRFEESGAARVQGSFPVSLEAHGIERPSLLFKKVDDTCRVDLDLVLRPEER
jgi:polyisoprenoid-binding protein YceI